MSARHLFQGPIPPTLIEVKKYAEHYYQHWQNEPSWLVRKVRQHEPIDSTSTRIKVSYDVVFAALKDLENRDGILTIPLDWFKKQVFVSLDVSGPWQSSVCFASRSESARIATYYVFGWLNQLSKSLLDDIDAKQVDIIYTILRGRKSLIKEEFECWLTYVEQCDFDWPITDKVTWHSWVANREFRRFFLHLCNSFVASVNVPSEHFKPSGRGVIKLSWEQPGLYQYAELTNVDTTQSSTPVSPTPSNPLDSNTPATVRIILLRFLVLLLMYLYRAISYPFCWIKQQFRRYGITPPSYLLAASSEPQLGIYASLVVPAGMRIDYVKCEDVEVDGESQKTTVAPNGYIYSENQTKLGDVRYVGTKAAVYVTQLDGLRLSALFRIRVHVKRGQFILPALFASLAGLAVSAALLLMFIKFESFAFPQDISSMVAVVAILPSAMAGYILFDREHEYVSVVLGSRRVLLVVSMIVTLTAVFTVNLALVLRSGIPHEDKPTAQTLAYIHRLSDTAEVAAFVTFATHLVAFLVFALDFLVTENWRHTFSRKFHLALAWLYAALLACCFLCAYCWMGVSLFHWYGAKTKFFAELPGILYHQARIVWQSV